jgi:hypothetical protein
VRRGSRDGKEPARREAVSMPLFRKNFLKLAASAPFVPMFSTAAAANLPAARPRANLRSGLHPDFLVSTDQVRSWIEWMSEQGPRYTGNPAHVTYINFLHEQFLAAGLGVQSYTYKFPRWDASSTGLAIRPPGGETSAVPVSSYYVRSGQTTAAGVTAPLVYGGTADGTALPVNASGSIVYLDFVMPPLPLQALFVPFGTYPTGTVAPTEVSAAYSFIVLPGFVALPGLGLLQSAGAVGALIGWTNISDAQAQYQYQPFTSANAEVPTLFVPQSQTASVRELALVGGTKAHLTLDATIYQNATTETIIATLPGMTDEIMIILTHTDGPNVVEENGGIALLSIARYFARIPKSARQKTLVFVATTGHMAEPLVSSALWIGQRPDIISKAVACVVIEHLGSQDWLDDPTATTWAYTGANEDSYAQTQNTGISDTFLSVIQGTAVEPTVVGNPAFFFGIGEPLNALGIPTNGFIMGPSYLLRGSPNGEIDKVTFPFLYAQIDALTAQIAMLDGMTAAQIAGTRVPVNSESRRYDPRERR